MIKFSNEVILFGETCVCFGVDPHVPSLESLGGHCAAVWLRKITIETPGSSPKVAHTPNYGHVDEDSDDELR